MRLHITRHDRKILGVCSGIAETYACDITTVRLITVIIAIVTGFLPATVVYLLMGLFLHKETNQPTQQQPPQPHEPME